jgi:hypothetical protein
MRLPRWLLVSLIGMSAVALVVLPAWIWIEMPRRTARAFIAAVQAGDEDRVNAILTSGVCYDMGTDDHLLRIDPPYGPSELFVPSRCHISTEKRTVSDIIKGQQLIVVGVEAPVAPYGIHVRFLFTASFRGVMAHRSPST